MRMIELVLIKWVLITLINDTILLKVRLQQGLPVLIDLLRFNNSSVVATVALTLRNLIIEKDSLNYIGTHSLPVLVSLLKVQPTVQSRSRSFSSLASLAPSSNHFSRQLNYRVILPILSLCSKIVLSQENFARFVKAIFSSHGNEFGIINYSRFNCIQKRPTNYQTVVLFASALAIVLPAKW